MDEPSTGPRNDRPREPPTPPPPRRSARPGDLSSGVLWGSVVAVLVLAALAAFGGYRYAEGVAARNAQQAAAACDVRAERVTSECKSRVDAASQELTTEKLAHAALRTRIGQTEERLKQGEERLKQAEERTGQAEQLKNQAEERIKQAEERTGQAEQLKNQAEERIKQAEERSGQAEQRIKQAEERIKQAEERIKQAEERTKQAEERLQQSEDRLRKQTEQISAISSRVSQCESHAGFLEAALRLTTIEPPKAEPGLAPEVGEHASTYKRAGESFHAVVQQSTGPERAKTLASYQAVQAAVAKNVANLLLAFESLGVAKDKIEQLSRLFRDSMPPG